MGMFDSFFAKCPKCSADVEWQSKAGACDLKEYRSDGVPAQIACDLNRKDATCEKCGAVVRFHAQVSVLVSVEWRS